MASPTRNWRARSRQRGPTLAAAGQTSPTQRRHLLQITPPLFCALLVAGLVLDGDQSVGAAPPFGGEVDVARSVPDALLDMAPPVLRRLQAPFRSIGGNQERAQLAAVG